MMKNSNQLLISYDYDKWYGYGRQEGIYTDTAQNSHTLICGMSGSGKSYLISMYFARICLKNNGKGEVYFADYKQDNNFSHLRGCPRYYPYKKTLEALEKVYDIMQNRQSGNDKSRFPVTLIWDEYIANILAIKSTDKKNAEMVMNKVSEILMLGRSLSVRLIVSTQRPDASAFPTGSRLNYGVIIVVGAAIKSIYEMLLPKEYINKIGERKFELGEGIVLLQGSQLHFIKVPMVKDMIRVQRICIDALS